MQGNLPPEEEMIRTTLYLPKGLITFMKEYKNKKGVSLTHFTRVALDERREKLEREEAGR